MLVVMAYIYTFRERSCQVGNRENQGIPVDSMENMQKTQKSKENQKLLLSVPLGHAKTPIKTCYIWYFPVAGIRINENHGNPRNSVEIMKIKEILLSVPLGHAKTPIGKLLQIQRKINLAGHAAQTGGPDPRESWKYAPNPLKSMKIP